MPPPMRFAAFTTPEIATGPYPERRDTSRRRVVPALRRLMHSLPGSDRRSHARFLARVHDQDERLSNLSQAAFQAQVREVRAQLSSSGCRNHGNALGFALVREATRRQ